MRPDWRWSRGRWECPPWEKGPRPGRSRRRLRPLPGRGSAWLRRRASARRAAPAHALGAHLDGGAIEEFALMAGGDRLGSGKAAGDADLVAADVAGDDHAEVGGSVFDDEDLEGVGSLVADYGVARYEDGVFAAGQQHLGGGEHAGAQVAVRILKARLQNEDTGTGIDGRVERGDLSGEVAAGVCGYAGLDLHAQFHLRCPLFGGL